ncbi:MAG TPA: hypothetical protein PLZ05_01350 [Alphaproteobacteria bacterium]|nr:hypothetical protein [Alphaproteobacteria bacterium]
MRKAVIFLIASIINTAAFAQESFLIGGDNFDVFNDLTVFEDSAIYSTNLNIKNSIYLQNLGEITSNVFVCDGCRLNVQNSGIMSGDISLGEHSELVQVIKMNSDITQMNVINSDYSILIQGGELVNLSNVLPISGGTSKIVLDNTVILIDNVTSDTTVRNITPRNVELLGNVKIKLNNSNELNGALLLSNVSGDGAVTVDVYGLDPLYNAMVERRDSDIYLKIYRETDYQKLLGDSRGEFINNLRTSSPYNPTIRAIDRAGSISEIYGILGKSIILNPINLMRPIKLFNEFENTRFSEIKNRRKSESVSAIIEPIYIFSNGLSMYAAKSTIINTTRNFLFSISGYGGYFNVSDDINEYSGSFYGGDIRVRYDNKYMWMDNKFGYTKSDFNAGTILEDNTVINNPQGNMIYGFSNIGVKFRYDGFYLSPYVGFGSTQESVAHEYDSSVFGNIGCVFGFNVMNMGLLYRYSAFINSQTDKIISGGLKMEVWSIDDAAGGSLIYQVIQDEIGLSNKISFNLKFSF